MRFLFLPKGLHALRGVPWVARCLRTSLEHVIVSANCPWLGAASEVSPEFAFPKSSTRAFHLGLANDLAESPCRKVSLWWFGRPDLEMLERRAMLVTIPVGAGDVAGLIDAINQANANPDADSIVLVKSHCELTAVNNSWFGPTGLPAIASPITIDGIGATIARTGPAAFRLFVVLGGPQYGSQSAGDLTLHVLTLERGLAKDGNSDYGGAVGDPSCQGEQCGRSRHGRGGDLPDQEAGSIDRVGRGGGERHAAAADGAGAVRHQGDPPLPTALRWQSGWHGPPHRKVTWRPAQSSRGSTSWRAY